VNDPDILNKIDDHVIKHIETYISANLILLEKFKIAFEYERNTDIYYMREGQNNYMLTIISSEAPSNYDVEKQIDKGKEILEKIKINKKSK